MILVREEFGIYEKIYKFGCFLMFDSLSFNVLLLIGLGGSPNLDV